MWPSDVMQWWCSIHAARRRTVMVVVYVCMNVITCTLSLKSLGVILPKFILIICVVLHLEGTNSLPWGVAIIFRTQSSWKIAPIKFSRALIFPRIGQIEQNCAKDWTIISNIGTLKSVSMYTTEKGPDAQQQPSTPFSEIALKSYLDLWTHCSLVLW